LYAGEIPSAGDGQMAADRCGCFLGSTGRAGCRSGSLSLTDAVEKAAGGKDEALFER
jgi:hypothetical protein